MLCTQSIAQISNPFMYSQTWNAICIQNISVFKHILKKLIGKLYSKTTPFDQI